MAGELSGAEEPTGPQLHPNSLFSPRNPSRYRGVSLRLRDRPRFGESRVRDANYLREQAKRCRALAKTAVEPDLIEQLRLWSVELADEADAVEWQDAENEETGNLR